MAVKKREWWKVPFTELQTKIYDWIPDNMSMTTTRRIMLIIAERLAERIDAKAIVNGENLGQVASQTLTSMHAINAVTNFPVELSATAGWSSRSVSWQHSSMP